MKRRFPLVTVALLAFGAALAAGCGGDSAPTPTPKGVPEDVPDLKIGDDSSPSEPAPSEPAPEPAPNEPAPAEPAPAEPAPSAPAPAGGQSSAGEPADAGFGHLKLVIRTDKAVAPANIKTSGPDCGELKIKEEVVVVNPKGNGLANVACWLDEDAPKIHPSYMGDKDKKVFLNNIKCRFEPHVSAMWTEQTLEIGNADAFGHNSKIDSFENESHNPIIPPGQTYEAKFANPETLPVSCNIHAWMKAYVVVQPHPLTGISAVDGALIIKNVPSGKQKFRMWHETGFPGEVKVNGKAAKWKKGRFELTIPDGGTLEVNIEIPADSLK
ncbi:MAG: hypothetical protein KDB14_11385 [Planctomycetales bacterium]|nr:hypothetical protein [Planctomycetales bacterium]